MRCRTIRILSLCILIYLVTGCDSKPEQVEPASNNSEERKITLAVLPYISAPRLYDTFSPLSDYLSDQIKRPVIIKTAVDIDSFMRQTLLHRYDLVVSNPLLYLTLNKQGGYQPLVADSNEFRTAFVAIKRKEIKSIKELNGGILGVLPDGALAGHNLPLDHLNRLGLNKGKDYKLKVYNSFDLILSDLLKGKIDVGCFWMPHYESLSDKTKNKMHILDITEQLVYDPYAVRDDLSEEMKILIREAFLKLNDSQQHKNILKSINVKSFIIVEDKHYDKMRDFAKRNNMKY